MKVENAFKQFDKLNTDRQRWQWLQKHNTEDYTVHLDNDETYVTFGDGETEMFCSFDRYIGNASGVGVLLSSLNIKWEDV